MKILINGNIGNTLLETIRTNDLHIRAPCAGRGVCGKCRVLVPLAGTDGLLSPPDDRELAALGEAALKNGVRLACLTRFLREGSLEIELDDDGVVSPVEEIAVDFDRAVMDAASASGVPLRVAVDIGTTTLAVCLLDAASGKILSIRTEANMQKSWGSDVVARMQSVIDDRSALKSMQQAVVVQIERLIKDQVTAAGRKESEVGSITVAGNTVMMHLFTGEDPTGMSRVPFEPVFLELRNYRAGDCGFTFLSDARVVVLPGISAFVGSDISAGILATGLDRSEKFELLLDIGTNGEIVLGNRDGMLSTATAAGPAFEGAHISHGCPGLPGALDHAGFNQDGFWFTTIGNEKLKGICGSGLLDLAAALLEDGKLDPAGFLEMPDDSGEFYVDGERTVCLTQDDIRQLQLAKGAMAAGVEVLCVNAGITTADISRVHLAGGFGAFMNPDSALAIGLLPAGLRGKIVPVGNTSLQGAIETIVSADALEKLVHIARKARTIDLSVDPAFQNAFIEAMMFPGE